MAENKTVGPKVTSHGASFSGRLLFVDDARMVADMAAQMLTRLGFEVAAFIDSNDAWHAFQDEPNGYTLIVTDQTMPNLTGCALAQKINALNPNVPIILFTGHSDSADKSKLADCGIRALGSKPYTTAEIGRIIQSVLHARIPPARR